MMEGPGADSEEKREPASDIDTGVVDSLKALDPEPPIREADIAFLFRTAELREVIGKISGFFLCQRYFRHLRMKEK